MIMTTYVSTFGLLVISALIEASSITREMFRCRTTSDIPCVFPFTFMGHTFKSCTTINNYGTPWCATEVDKNGEYIGQWANCGDNCPVVSGDDVIHGCVTTEERACVFPFRYNGFDYYSCTGVGNNGILWCATRVTRDGEYDNQWGNCGGNCRR